ncbi:SpoIIE family protein phosphatase [Actinoplanes sp. NPDC051851]|uniref:SpoIIE family protein phosphatase n=1 Tax=Actinoplanes sp. NPDC051851 TaxID=3154753 RepID=UPI00341301BC
MLVRKLIDSPMAVVCLVDVETQHLAGHVGMPSPFAESRRMPLSHSFSRHVVLSGEMLVVPDTRADPRTRDNPAIAELGAIAYAGAPITDPDGLVVGALCAVDVEPRAWTPSEITFLGEMAAVCSSEACLRITRAAEEEARRTAEEARRTAEEAHRTAEEARHTAESAHHQLELLADLTEALAATMDVEEGMRRLGRIVTERLADWCVVALEDGPLITAVHRDPEQAGTMERFTALAVRSRPDIRAVMAAARRTGRIARDVAPELIDAELRAIAEEAGLAEALIAPVLSPVQRRVLGAVILVNGPTRTRFSSAEVRTVAEIGRRAGMAVENSRLYREQRHVSEVLQRSLLTELPVLPGVELHARYLPAQNGAAVGGDWYDAFEQPDGSVMVAVGDVSGHDIEAAATMGQLRNLVRGDAYGRDDEPGALLTELDQALHGLRVPAAATAVLARVRRAHSGYSVSFANAGHPPPLLLLPDGRVQVWWVPPEPLLGLPPHDPRTTTVRYVPPGSTLLLYTDGLVEDREQLLDDGVARLSEALRAAATRPGDEVCERLLRVAPRRSDDIALLLVRLT